ncbi:kinase-like domain-containing protein [Russula brevipes]|nr:kinase-like domain-containing protein [Russula brevipes]
MDVLSLSRQFIEGVDFLHQHGVAHCDLKPGNVVVLFIIDFDLAEWVEGVKTMMKGWCGTRPWVAPDLGSKDDPQLYSPILADRWACGRVIHHFLEYIPAFEFQHFRTSPEDFSMSILRQGQN